MINDYHFYVGDLRVLNQYNLVGFMQMKIIIYLIMALLL